MIQEHFQLQREPFRPVPSPHLYYPAASIEASRMSLVRLIERSQGPGLVIGQTGTGKSLLCLLVAESFRRLCRVVVLPSGRLSNRRALLQALLYELGLPYRNADEGELRLTLIDHVTNQEVCPHGILLLVDEGEALSLALLDELRSLTNLTHHETACVRMTLFGAPRLEERFTDPRLESFNQRIAGRFYLEPFNVEETCNYIVQTFQNCGGEASEIFEQAALIKIHRASGGIPRLINQLTDHALVLAAIGNYNLVTSACVDEAWADLQQLPLPQGSPARETQSAMPSNIVEFGDIDDVDHEKEASKEPNGEFGTEKLDNVVLSNVSSPSAASNANEPHQESREREFHLIAESPTEAGEASEMTLVFHSAANPFGEDFEEEELVVDEFISPDAIAQRHRRQVQNEASNRIAKNICDFRHRSASDATINPDGAPTDAEPPSAQDSDAPGDAHTEDIEDKPREIICLDDHLAQAPSNQEFPTSTTENVSAESIEDPDRENTQSSGGRNYRNLFSQLRRRQG